MRLLNAESHLSDPEFDKQIGEWIEQEIPDALNLFSMTLNPLDFIRSLEDGVYRELYFSMSAGFVDEILSCRVRARVATKGALKGKIIISWWVKVIDASKKIVSSRGIHELVGT